MRKPVIPPMVYDPERRAPCFQNLPNRAARLPASQSVRMMKPRWEATARRMPSLRSRPSDLRLSQLDERTTTPMVT